MEYVWIGKAYKQAEHLEKKSAEKYETFKGWYIYNSSKRNCFQQALVAKEPPMLKMAELVNIYRWKLSESRVRENRTHGLKRGDEVRKL